MVLRKIFSCPSVKKGSDYFYSSNCDFFLRLCPSLSSNKFLSCNCYHKFGWSHSICREISSNSFMRRFFGIFCDVKTILFFSFSSSFCSPFPNNGSCIHPPPYPFQVAVGIQRARCKISPLFFLERYFNWCREIFFYVFCCFFCSLSFFGQRYVF